jgi:BlaI family transcriptional regulator, penicillinase repressor
VTLEREVGPLQMRILGLLDDDAGLSVADVQLRLSKSGHEAAYTTVMTVLGRLYEKGLVRRERSGKRYVYHTARRASANKARILQRVHRALFKNERLAPIAALVEGDLSRAELEQLRQLIDEKLGDGDG